MLFRQGKIRYKTTCVTPQQKLPNMIQWRTKNGRTLARCERL